MKRYFAIAFTAVLFVSTVWGGTAIPRDPNGAEPAAGCTCSYSATPYVATYSQTENLQVCDNPVAYGNLTFNGVITINASYCPSKSKLNFDVEVTFTGSNCTSSMSSASGWIGPYSFTMSQTTFTINGLTFPVTPNVGGGSPWTAAGALTGITDFDCSTWTLGSGSVSGVSCITISPCRMGGPSFPYSRNINVPSVTPTSFSCSCQ